MTCMAPDGRQGPAAGLPKQSHDPPLQSGEKLAWMKSQSLSCLRSLEPQQDVIREHTDSGTTSQKHIGIRPQPHNTRKSVCPSFKITGRHRNSDTLNGFKTESRNEHMPDRTHGRIMDMEDGTVAKP